MTETVTQVVDIADMSLGDLTGLYNRFSDRPIRKFKNTGQGKTRLEQLLPKVGRLVAGTKYEVPATDGEAREPSKSYEFVPTDFTGDEVLIYANPRDSREGSNAAADKAIFAEMQGRPVREIAPRLKTRWGAIRYWKNKGTIELVTAEEYARRQQRH